MLNFSNKFRYNLSLLLTIFLSFQLSSASLTNASDICLDPLKELISSKNSAVLPQFKMAPQEVLEEARLSFLKQKESGSFEKKIDPSAVKRVTAENIHNLAGMSEVEIKKLTEEGLAHIEELSVVTSGAGLWSRGGGSVKALVPYNIAELLGKDFAELSHAGKIVAAKNSEDILKLSKVDLTGLSAEQIMTDAKALKSKAMISIRTLLEKTVYDPRAINTLDMKFANLAAIYKKTGKYVSMDIWTSEQTHKSISNYLIWLQKNIQKKSFHQDPLINASIKQSLFDYFKKSKELGENHLFGYQEGMHAIDAKTGLYKVDTAPIGKGAGAIVEYLDRTGRMDLLKSRGKKTLVFENIEVVSDYTPLFASHRMAEKPVSVVLVPQREGYVGGSPFLIKKDNGNWNLELLEQSVLSDEFKKGNEYFNTNTIFFSTEVRPPQTIGFELKDQNTIARVKQNMGDVTLDNPTHGIGGRLGRDQKMIEYENFKSYDEYGENGGHYIKIFQDSWKDMLK